jgi:hypothetical protein
VGARPFPAGVRIPKRYHHLSRWAAGVELQGETQRPSGLEKVLSASLLGSTEAELVRERFPSLEELATAPADDLAQLGVARDVAEHLVRAARLELASARLNLLLGIGEGKAWALADAGFETVKLVASAPRVRLDQLMGGAGSLAHGAAAEIAVLLAASNMAEGEPGNLREALARTPRSAGPGQSAMQRLVKLERRLVSVRSPEDRRVRLEEAERLSLELLEGTPGQPDLWFSVACLRASQGNWPGCLEAVGEAIKRAPGDRLSLRMKALALEAIGKGESGRYFHHKALKLLMHENRRPGSQT